MGLIHDIFDNKMPIQRQPQKIVSTFGNPEGEYVFVGDPSEVTLYANDEWVGEITEATSTTPHWWELGMNVYNGFSDLTDLTSGIRLNGDVVYDAGVGTNWSHTIFVPANSTLSIEVWAGGEDPQSASLRLYGYAAKALV